MSSFFEKLKKGMGVETVDEPEEETATEESKREIKGKAPKFPTKKKPVKKASSAPVTKLKIDSDLAQPEVKQIEKEGTKKPELPKPESKEEEIAEDNKSGFDLQSLSREEGQLAVDVYQTDTHLVIQATIAGVKPENLDISIEADTVSIKGERNEPPEQGEKNYFYQECYWGPFSRQIILPEETDPSRAEATMREGVLTIRIPKIERKKKRKIAVKG